MKITEQQLKQIIKEEVQMAMAEARVASYKGYEHLGLYSKLDERGMKPEDHEKYADVWKREDPDVGGPYAIYKLRESEFQRSIESPTPMTQREFDSMIPVNDGGKCTERCWRRVR